MNVTLIQLCLIYLRQLESGRYKKFNNNVLMHAYDKASVEYNSVHQQLKVYHVIYYYLFLLGVGSEDKTGQSLKDVINILQNKLIGFNWIVENFTYIEDFLNKSQVFNLVIIINDFFDKDKKLFDKLYSLITRKITLNTKNKNLFPLMCSYILDDHTRKLYILAEHPEIELQNILYNKRMIMNELLYYDANTFSEYPTYNIIQLS